MSLQLALLPAIPLFTAALLALAGRRLGRAAGWLATFSITAALFVAAPLALAAFTGKPVVAVGWPVLAYPALTIDAALRLDPLAGVLLLGFLALALLVHLQAVVTVSDPPTARRLFAALGLSTGLMILVLTAENLLLLLAAWTGLTLAASFLTTIRRDGMGIGAAGVRTFLTNSLGDAALLMGLFLLARFTGRLDVPTILAKAPELALIPAALAGLPVSLLDVIAILFFLGIAGKAAQFPLHGWFVDASSSPMAAGAFVHALTLPVAGLFLALRLEPLFATAVVAREIIIGLSVFTAFTASIIALTQTDFLKLLSWAAMSRNGLILAGVIAGASAGAMTHLVMQMLFMTILFLAAGFVIRSLKGGADIRSMGGLWRRTPFTFSALLVGAFGFVGLPFTPGFDATFFIVESTVRRNPSAGALLVATLLVLALAMTRMVMAVFLGAERFDREASEHCHETIGSVLLSLVMLAVGGYAIGHLALASRTTVLPPVRSAIIAAVFSGILIGVIRYRRRTPHSTPIKEFIRSGFGWDAIVSALLVTPFSACAVWSRDAVERVGIDSVAQGLGMFGAGLGESMSAFRSSRLSTALVTFVVGVLLLVWVLAR